MYIFLDLGEGGGLGLPKGSLSEMAILHAPEI